VADHQFPAATPPRGPPDQQYPPAGLLPRAADQQFRAADLPPREKARLPRLKRHPLTFFGLQFAERVRPPPGSVELFSKRGFAVAPKGLRDPLHSSPGAHAHPLTHISGFQPAGRQALARWRKPRGMKRLSFSESPARGDRSSSKNTGPLRMRSLLREIRRCRRRPAAPGGAVGYWEIFSFPGLTPPGYMPLPLTGQAS
jgi:hypothetical protein